MYWMPEYYPLHMDFSCQECISAALFAVKCMYKGARMQANDKSAAGSVMH